MVTEFIVNDSSDKIVTHILLDKERDQKKFKYEHANWK